MRTVLLAVFSIVLGFAVPAARAQWTILDAHTKADLRGIDNVGNGVAWASGSGGTVLRTEDNGYVWQLCATPPGAEKLDFRGIQAFDSNTAIVMSSGPGDQSRLYKTTDGCATWKLVFTNPDKDGFWDALVQLSDRPMSNFLILGDPVRGKFQILDGNAFSPTPFLTEILKPPARKGEAAFAASNTSLVSTKNNGEWLVTGGISGARIIIPKVHAITDETGWTTYPSSPIPVGNKSESSGGFSIGMRTSRGSDRFVGVVVGGDYAAPTADARTAAFTTDSGKTWQSSTTSPHGYRSAVAYDEAAKTWITVGPNGTDVSTDDGKNWRALKPAADDAPDADKNWNALSLPFVVGPKGRIGILRESALKAAAK